MNSMLVVAYAIFVRLACRQASTGPDRAMYAEIKERLRELYLADAPADAPADARPWLVGFSGGKDSTMLASLVFEALLGLPQDLREKPVTILCTDTRKSLGNWRNEICEGQ